MGNPCIQALCDRFADLVLIEETKQHFARGARPAFDHIDLAETFVCDMMVDTERVLCHLPVRCERTEARNIAGIRCDVKIECFCSVIFCVYIIITGKIGKFHSHFLQIDRNLKSLIIFLQIIIKSQAGSDTVPIRVYMS